MPRRISESVNTLVFEDGRILGFSTDAAVLDGLPAERPVVLGDGGRCGGVPGSPAAGAHVRAAAATGRRTSDDADLVVNATSERDEMLVELGSGQTLVDLPYPETATATGRP